ncbi:hypothetical protein NGI46_26920 [Peribacillus butanolivorans]|uniref:hypothetical protein n=1 Tax=Peribacillus butanolivorans TaxID=421767 RepID=UPI00207C7A0C|nr:hypothetical protein [Peribacillus butanolivorans]MCO0600952.1 hypothetical protein [Peribacillus butanolivorans]
MNTQWTLEKAKKAFDEVGLILKAKVYKNTKEHMEYECKECGFIGTKPLTKVNHRKQGCKICGKAKGAKSRRMTIDELKEKFVTLEAELITTEYHKRDLPLKFKCLLCDDIGERTYASVFNSKLACLSCGHKLKIKNKTKYTIEVAKKVFLEIGLELLEEHYLSFHEDMKYRCLDCDYKGEKSLSVAKAEKGCPKCAGIIPLTYDEVKDLFNEFELNLEEEEYINARTGMKYTCLKCGKQGTKTADSLKAGKGCKGCSTIETSTNQRLPYEVVKTLVESIGWTLLSRSYEGNSKKLHMKCEKGHDVFTNLNNVRNGKRCKKCSGLESPSLEERISVFFNLNLDLIEKEYKNGNTPLKYKCLECGYFGDKTWKSARNGFGCLACSPSSIGEERIANWLKLNNIPHKRQFRIAECRNKKTLPFDFAILNKEDQLVKLIEFDGEQHFTARDYFGGEKAFIKRQENDKIKDIFCLNNNLSLLRISFLEVNQIEGILDKELGLINI